tara:strand:+ start:48 stop:914 length:867 start_codon:yes stop_codon:yes gene_type:complete
MARHKQHNNLDPEEVRKKLNDFFIEDNIQEDITTLATQTTNQNVQAVFLAKENLYFSGKEIIIQGFSDCQIIRIENDGEYISKGQSIAVLQGSIQTILSKERVVLNLLQRLSGITSKTKALTKITKPYNIELLDTRKTTPGLRMFEKFAVCVGGGINHRYSLKDSIMIKDNHLMGLEKRNDILEVTKKLYKTYTDIDLEIEVDTKEQLDLALESSATSILLDNFSPEQLKNIIPYIRNHTIGNNKYIEISGGITETTLTHYCIKGANGISMGCLTHNIQSKDISLDIT